MIPTADYHMHTYLCGHAIGEPYEYADHALSIGLTEIGFSDHAPFLKHPLPGITMSRDELPEYHRMIEMVRGEYAGRLKIKIGIEADYLPGYEDETRTMLADYPYDYVYGSVHFIGEWGFDNPDERQRWDQADINAVYRDYYALLRRSAASGLFDIMAHVDLVKKFGYRPTVDLAAEIRETARTFKSHGVMIEINTSGLRKQIQEIYPSLEALKIYAEENVGITFGSDSHFATDVGRDFDKARDLALAAGYRDYAVFRQREVEERRPLI